MAKKWRNSGFVAKYLTKFALFEQGKMAVQNHLEPSNGERAYSKTGGRGPLWHTELTEFHIL